MLISQISTNKYSFNTLNNVFAIIEEELKKGSISVREAEILQKFILVLQANREINGYISHITKQTANSNKAMLLDYVRNSANA